MGKKGKEGRLTEGKASRMGRRIRGIGKSRRREEKRRDTREKNG